MPLNSLRFFVFLPLVALARRLAPARFRPALLLAASYTFCLLLSPACALALFGVTCAAWGAGRAMEAYPARRRGVCAAALFAVLGLLAFLKYYGLFASLTGAPALRLLLPAGLSFFTFQAAGYVIDVCRGDAPAQRDFLALALFLAFFPQVTSGPIGRAGALLPQLLREDANGWDDLAAGAPLFLWGLFKKLAVADVLAAAVNTAFAAPRDFTPVQLAFASLLFTIQIYCDFSGYTDMARGAARALGVTLARNFDAPYFAVSVRDFWRRWHISLSSWFRDYLYIPLGGSRRGRLRACVNLLIVFAVSGLWHGAALTFLVWGLLHGVYQAVGVLTRGARERFWRALRVPEESRLRRFLGWVLTLTLVSAAWIFFKAASVGDALYILRAVTPLRAAYPFDLTLLGLSRRALAAAAVCTALALGGDLFLRGRDAEAYLLRRTGLRYAVYFLLILAVCVLGAYGAGFDPQDFIYFQF